MIMSKTGKTEGIISNILKSNVQQIHSKATDFKPQFHQVPITTTEPKGHCHDRSAVFRSLN